MVTISSPPADTGPTTTHLDLSQLPPAQTREEIGKMTDAGLNRYFRVEE